MSTHRSFPVARLGCAVLLALAAGCSPERLVANAGLPPDVPDPGTTKTPAGAVAAYHGVIAQFNVAFAGTNGRQSVVPMAGMLADELRAPDFGAPAGVTSGAIALDSRLLPEVQNAGDPAANLAEYADPYGLLQAVRGQAHEARGLLLRFTPDSTALLAHVDAVEGMADLLLADLFCSGIPLSTLDYNGDYTLAAGSSTTEVYQRALALFDSALALAGDSTRVRDLASVAKGRVLLALGDYAGAGRAVAGVPDGFSYTADYTLARNDTYSFSRTVLGTWFYSVADGEGGNGLPYRTSGDPRTASSPSGKNQYGVQLYHPDKYTTTGTGPVVVADWIEARLIEAEAALQAGDATTWLAKLNYLRANAISPALPALTDPGTPDARVDLLFRERAYWLFLTAHRQGDLRRLVRVYGRDQSKVYPVGPYRGGAGSYGNDVTFPIPVAERLYNPLFTGCINRGA